MRSWRRPFSIPSTRRGSRRYIWLPVLLAGLLACPCKTTAQGNDAVYLLVTDDALATAFGPLVSRRSSQGNHGKLVTVSSIEAAYPGRDTPEKIRNCIKEHHARHGTVFLALGGDDTIVPCRFCAPNTKTNVVADLYYADMGGGSWDMDDDGIFGEAGELGLSELTPEVWLGRITVRTPSQVATYIRKVLAYETANPDGFACRLMLVGGGDFVMADDRPANVRYHDPATKSEGSNLETYVGAVQPYWQAMPLHGFFRAISPWDESACGDYALCAENVSDRLNNGNYHFVFASGHAGPSHWVLYGGEGYGTRHVAELTNSLPFIVWSGGCSAAEFDGDKDPLLSEAFLRNPDGGAVVVFGHTKGLGSAGGTTRRQVYDELFKNRREYTGECFGQALRALAASRVSGPTPQLAISMQGDPALKVWREESGRQLQIFLPYGGEAFEHGTNVAIRWNAAGTGFLQNEEVRLEYSGDSGGTWLPITGAGQLPYDGRVFDWESESLATGRHYRVRATSLSDPAVTHCSQRDFSIMPIRLLTVRSEPVGGVSVGGTHGYKTDYSISAAVGDRIGLEAPAVQDLTFLRWKDADGATISVSPTFQFVMQSNIVLTAEYGYPGPLTSYFVSPSGDDANDGITPDRPMRRITVLLARYGGIGWGNELVLSAGRFPENLHLARAHDGLTIRGAGPGETIIDGGGAGSCLSVDKYVSCYMSGITFTGGTETHGGAIHGEGGLLRITNCVFSANSASSRGGAIQAGKCSYLAMWDCLFSSNRADSAGGAIAASKEAIVELDRCIFVDNSSGASGGALRLVDTASAILTGCDFRDNRAGGGGGAMILMNRSTLSARQCTFSDNTADGKGGVALSSDNTAITFDQCVLTQNSATQGGAARSRDNASLCFLNSLLVGNNATQEGGALRLLGQGRAVLMNTTVAYNDCGTRGGAAFCSVDSSLAATNSIIQSNTASNADPNISFQSGGSLDLGYCCTSPLVPGPGNIEGDPSFVDRHHDDFHLGASSPCVDAGTRLVGLTRDLDGIPRPLDGNGDTQSKWDIGAYEFRIPDFDRPAIDIVRSPGTPNQVLVRFSEKVERATAEVAGNYTIDDGIGVTNVQLRTNGCTIALGVTTLRLGATYTLTVSNVVDLAHPPNRIAAGSRAEFELCGEIGECGTIWTVQQDSNEWHTINFLCTYADPVVAMGPPSCNGSEPTTVRVKGVTSSNFQWQIDEWDYLDGFHVGESVGYVVMETGSHMLSHGKCVEAGYTVAGSRDAPVGFAHQFLDTPVVLGQVTTVADPRAAVPRHFGVTNTGFAVLLHGQEANKAHDDETVSWIAMEQGLGMADAELRYVGVTSSIVDSNWYGLAFVHPHPVDSVVLAAMQSMNGADSCALRCRNHSATGIEFMVEEEWSADGELWHATEAVGYVVLRPGPLYADTERFDADADGMSDAWEIRHFGSTTAFMGAPEADWDGDGLCNRNEFRAGTDPTNRYSVLKIVGFCPTEQSDGVVIGWQSVTDRTYVLEWTSNLLTGSMQAFMTDIRGLPPLNSCTVNVDRAGEGFYRVRLAE